MLIDANGEERKGIWILGRVLHLCPSRVMCEATNDELVDILSSEGDETSVRFYKTIRDLMLAGF